ncbi:small multidrug resistance family-3 protein [Meinhardsimonia xiamenensis]|jgi:small multidrug resistance family-3 protein|uniref:Small multidrug resistance family-3 protein n=1 Tax=Meinhardsimonia xiamenensis TaxID=990712 RepID=A0A1G8YRZ2_9RHOB|nr:YnfA family protein [Meinhardsimonia xiamenensis]PRX37414.1 small multidrug resistance family-3 protein [Meinhardsimonia xiamenensis]SDK05517.1 small multidrug resistance family-3 protein [Meinhardsimonia xiamenensis]
MGAVLKGYAVFLAAALAEIGGCYCLWMWLRLGRSALWLLPAMVLLVFFGALLTRVDVAFAGRAYAAYGGVYIAASLGWLWLVERQTPDRWDALGVALCLAGAGVMLLAPHARG